MSECVNEYAKEHTYISVFWRTRMAILKQCQMFVAPYELHIEGYNKIAHINVCM